MKKLKVATTGTSTLINITHIFFVSDNNTLPTVKYNCNSYVFYNAIDINNNNDKHTARWNRVFIVAVVY